MAGIGIELRKLTNYASFWNFFRAYLYAGILSSGAWVIATGTLTGIYIFLYLKFGNTLYNIQFLIAATYLVSGSLILSSLFQHSINRLIADILFEKKKTHILPNIFASVLVLMPFGAAIGFGLGNFLLWGEPLSVKILMASCFVMLCFIWLFSNALTGLERFRLIFASFFLGYATIFVLAVYLYPYQLTGLLLAFYIGHAIILLIFFFSSLKQFPSPRLIRFEIFHFMKRNQAYVYGGLFFFLGLFIAYIIMIPGLLVFF